MVRLVRYISAAALVTVSSAAPMVRRDGSAIGSEIPVSAPFGIPMSDVPSSTDSSPSASTAAAPPPMLANSMPPMASSMPLASSMPMASSMAMASSSIMVASSSTMMAESTSTAWMSSETMPSPNTYGSGSSSWGSGYDSCVKQCAASHAMPPMVWTPSSTQSSSWSGSGSSDSGSSGNGVTHTVIVAPTQGVLRYIPFSTNASVGDTVSFIWGAGPHTVTQSSALEVCNKTSAPGAFLSGVQNKTFVFNQVVNNTNPIWFYCGIPGHCEKGMFGGINIGQADPTGSMPSISMSGASMPSSTSSSYMPLSSMMSNLTMMHPDMSALWTYTKSKTGSNAYANGWGMNTNCAGMSPDAMMQTAENVMYMQTLIAANPQAMQGGKFAVTNANNLTIPPDIQVALANANGMNSTMPSTASASGGPSAAAAAASSVMPASTSTAAKSNGARSITSPSVVIGLVAIVATFFAI